MINLDNSNSGKNFLITAVNGGFGFRQRMAEMGIMINSVIKVVKNDHSGPLIIMVKGARIALGRGMANKILGKEL